MQADQTEPRKKFKRFKQAFEESSTDTTTPVRSSSSTPGTEDWLRVVKNEVERLEAIQNDLDCLDSDDLQEISNKNRKKVKTKKVNSNDIQIYMPEPKVKEVVLKFDDQKPQKKLKTEEILKENYAETPQQSQSITDQVPVIIQAQNKRQNIIISQPPALINMLKRPSIIEKLKQTNATIRFRTCEKRPDEVKLESLKSMKEKVKQTHKDYTGKWKLVKHAMFDFDQSQKKIIDLEDYQSLNDTLEEYFPYEQSKQIEDFYQNRLCNSGKKMIPLELEYQIKGANQKIPMRVQGKNFEAFKHNSTWIVTFPPMLNQFKIYREEISLTKVLNEHNGLLMCKSEQGTTIDNVGQKQELNYEVHLSGTKKQIDKLHLIINEIMTQKFPITQPLSHAQIDQLKEAVKAKFEGCILDYIAEYGQTIEIKIFGYVSQDAKDWVITILPKLHELKAPDDWVDVILDHIEQKKEFLVKENILGKRKGRQISEKFNKQVKTKIVNSVKVIQNLPSWTTFQKKCASVADDYCRTQCDKKEGWFVSYIPINHQTTNYSNRDLMSIGPCGKAAYFTEDASYAFEKSVNKEFIIYAEFIANYEEQKPFSTNALIQDALFREKEGDFEMFAVNNPRMWYPRFLLEIADAQKEEF